MSIHEVCLLAGGFAFLALLLRLSVDDIRTGFLYNRWTLFSAISGALLGGGLLFAVRMLSRGGIGGGDVKLAAALGLWTGHTGILPALFVAFLLGSLWGIVLLLRGYGRKAKLPFGPCLAIGGVVGVGFGNEICAFYEALF